MLVKTLVRSISRGGSAEKPYALLAVETEQPLEIIEIRLFKNSIDDGTVSRLESVVGQQVMLPLHGQVYQGRMQYQLPFGAVVQLPAKAQSQAKAG